MIESHTGTAAAIEVLRWCLRAEAGEQEASPPRYADAIWHDLLAVASRHHVVGVIAGQRDGLDLAETTRGQLRDRQKSAVAASLPVRSTAVTVVGALERAGVRCLTYKGPALAALTTGNPSARGAGDVDLLVAPEDVPTAQAVLHDQGARFVPGYTPDSTSPLWPAARRLNCEMPYRWRGTDIDLHWRIDRLPQIVAVPFDDLWERRQAVDLGGGTVATLGDEDALLVTAAHGTKEHWRHWRWTVDMVRQSRGIEDWPRVRELARASGCEAALAVALAMHEFLAPLPPRLDLAPGATPRQLATVAWQNACAGEAPFGSVSIDKQLDRLRWTMATLPSPRALGSMVVRQAWTTLDMAEFPMPVALVWAYPLVRPFLWGRRLRTGRFGPSALRKGRLTDP